MKEGTCEWDLSCELSRKMTYQLTQSKSVSIWNSSYCQYHTVVT